jgi:hypothetical protein
VSFRIQFCMEDDCWVNQPSVPIFRRVEGVMIGEIMVIRQNFIYGWTST